MKKLSPSTKAGPMRSGVRATIPHAARHTAGIGVGGKRHPQFDPCFEVEHQDEPTAGDPRRQHQKLAGEGHSIGKVPR